MGRQGRRRNLFLGLLSLGFAACADEPSVGPAQVAGGEVDGRQATDAEERGEPEGRVPPTGGDSERVPEPSSDEVQPRDGAEQAPDGPARVPVLDGELACDAAATPTALPESRFNFAAALAPDGRIFLVGGSSKYYAKPPSALSLAIYDPRDGSYRDLRSAPFAPRGVPAATFVQGWLVVSAGEVARYSWAEDRWYTSANPNRILLNRAAVAGSDGRAYFFGGLGDSGIMTAVADAYDPQTDSWTSLPAMPFPVNGAAAVHLNGQFYVMGPQAAVLDAQTLTWRTAATPLTPRYWLGAAVDPAGRILAIGGYPAGGVGASAAVEVYDPQTNRWSADGTLNVPVMNMATVAACGGIYLLGGSALGGVVKTVQRLDSTGWSVSQ